MNVINTERLRLRPWTSSEADIAAWVAKPAAVYSLGRPA
jgi:hypothetical protein